MKSVEIFCASPASTAICSSMEQRSMARQGMRHMERRHRLGGGGNGTTTGRQKPRTHVVPCSSSSDITIISPTTFLEKSSRRRSTSSTSDHELLPPPPPPPPRRKSSADVTDHHRLLLSNNPIFELFSSSSEHPSSATALVPTTKQQPVKINNSKHNHHHHHHHHHHNRSPAHVNYKLLSNHLHAYTNKSPLSSSLPPPAPPSGTDYSDQYPHQKSLSSISYKQHSSPTAAINNRSNSVSTAASPPQVVELRVSIHCKGCEGKIRKHISRMEGVISFSTDLATKKVTVVGNVTPLGVLTSISKVKYAEFWETPTSSSSPSSSSSS